ncbi:unnamed protein product, partial [Rotaria sp. Silwood1]
MGEYDKAERTYRQLMNQMSQNSYVRGECLDGLGTIAMRNGRYAEAIDHGIHAVQLYENHQLQDLLLIAKKYNNLGMAYGASGVFSRARHHFERSNKLKYYLFHNDQHMDMADTYDNIGNCYEFEGDFDQAEKHFHLALTIRITNTINLAHDVLPFDHPLLGVCYNNLDEDYVYMFDYAEAKNYFDKALEVYQFTYGSDHPEMKRTQDNITKMITALSD